MKILLADDEPIARTMLEHWLGGWGYTVTAVKDGEAALEALRVDPEIRMAVVDWVMPKLDGVGVCRSIRSGPNEPYIYVLLLTARDNKADIVEGLDAGADDYLIKPCNPLELKVRLRAGRRVVELQEQLVNARESLRFEAMHDALTGMLNRRAVLEQLERELLRSARRGAPVAVLMADLDAFKALNDEFGNTAGDSVLRETARRMKGCVRAYDSVGRIGGEEILCVLPECSAEVAFGVAERIGASLAQTPVTTSAGAVPISAGIGVASTDQLPGATAEQLLRAADAALLCAKQLGRGRFSLATPQDFSQRRSGDFGVVQQTASSS
jgi:two-component system, cell cycle response regulator